METNVKSRLLAYLRYKRVSNKEFCVSIGVSGAYVANMAKGISSDKLVKIREVYPDLSIEWLMTGEGDMLISPKKEKISDEEDSPSREIIVEAMRLQVKEWIKERDYWRDRCITKDEQIKALEAALEDLRSKASCLSDNSNIC